MARPPRCAWHAYRHHPSRRWGTYTSRLHGRSKAVMVRPHSITVSGAGRHQSDYAISLGIDSRPYAGVCRLASPRLASFVVPWGRSQLAQPFYQSSLLAVALNRCIRPAT